jgi:hypothetical protein
MEPTDAEKAKARRAQVILYGVMAALILLPALLYWLLR